MNVCLIILMIIAALWTITGGFVLLEHESGRDSFGCHSKHSFSGLNNKQVLFIVLLYGPIGWFVFLLKTIFFTVEYSLCWIINKLGD